MTRLVDYFVEIVAVPAEQMQQSENLERQIVRRMPLNDHNDFALPDGLPYFCIPESKAFFNPLVYERKPTFFSFILTGGDGVHAYGFALHFFEEYTTGVSDWRPRVLCLISHCPFFSLFKEIVSWIYRSRYQKMRHSRVQAKIAHACEDFSWFVSPRHVPLAILQYEEHQPFSRGSIDRNNDSTLAWDSGRDKHRSTIRDNCYHILSQLLQIKSRPLSGEALNIRFYGQDFFCYRVQRGKALHLDDYCFQMLFQCLSLKNVIYIINCLLLEQRVLVHSSHQGYLTPICEALCALLFPFCWKHVFIPFLPVKLIDYLQAPVPYFIGLQTSSLATKVGAEMFASCVVVHLDKDKVVSPIFSRVDDYSVDFVLPRLPSKEVTVILALLERVVPNPVGHSSSIQSNTYHIPESPQQSVNAVNEVELTFGEGPLGITFESTHLRLLAASNFNSKHQLGGSAVVKSLPRLRNGLVGPAECSGLIFAGSYLIGINGQSTLDLTFTETIDYLRHASRPICLRFLNARLPYWNACNFAERLQALSLVSASQVTLENQFLSWVDTLRGAFAAMFASMFCDYQRYIGVHRQEKETITFSRPHALPSPEQYGRLRRRSFPLASFAQFDYSAFCSAVPSNQAFLLEFTQTQCFADFVNESVTGTRARDASSPLRLFHECIYLIRESSNARAAIILMFERNGLPLKTAVIDLPVASKEDECDTKAYSLRKHDANCSSKFSSVEV
ncbi:unnamed protein product [Peronospora belbahrii]|uniref:UDENN domain-containing protein n=1 Tax=Peronospora belbahrii TaxID=622444 RepID=A0AAU9L666_9STRA|nr:unnamed protein product [Peronospora belbahrii]CAH0517305.1 unnamed protein product [Peronospora belbahrii]